MKLENISQEILDNYKDKSDKSDKMKEKFMNMLKGTKISDSNSNAIINDYHPIDSRSLDDYIIGTDNSSKDVTNYTHDLSKKIISDTASTLDNDVNINDNEYDVSSREPYEDLIDDLVNTLSLYSSTLIYDKFREKVKSVYEYRKNNHLYIGDGLKKIYKNLERMW